MLLDAQEQLSDSQAATTNATSVSTNSYDCGNVTPKRQIGDGEPLVVVVNVEAITAAADTFTIELISSTAANLGTSVKGHGRTRVLTAAEIPVGTILAIPIPPGAPTQRYLGVRTTLGAADALTYSAYVTSLRNVPKGAFYASGFLVS